MANSRAAAKPVPSSETKSLAATDPLSAFHPVIQAWFKQRFDAPTDAQAAGWPLIRDRRDVLIAAPTGSGKTFAAFLAGIDSLLRQAEARSAGGNEFLNQTQIVYVSPLKALSNDIQRNLEGPLAEISELARDLGLNLPPIRAAVRTGDTPQKDRQSFIKTPPHILITTPESLYLMLTAQRARETLRQVQTVIVDEIHALVRDKRGSHLSLTLARLDHVCETRPARIGLSATQRPIEEIAAYLVGSPEAPDPVLINLASAGSGESPGSGVSPGFKSPRGFESPASAGSGVSPGLKSSPGFKSPRGFESPASAGSGVSPGLKSSPGFKSPRGFESPASAGSGVSPGLKSSPGFESPASAGSGVSPGFKSESPASAESGVSPGFKSPPGFKSAASSACAIVDLGHQRDIELHIEVPPADLEAVAAREQWSEIYDRIAGLIRAHHTTLIFVNTRRLSERVAHNLRERLGEEAVASHHGSLSKDRRHRVEQRLKDGELKALVATASLELGIDIGSIDLVCQVGSPRGISTFLQRVGRSGHALGLRPQGRLFPTSRDELIECAALIRAVRGGRLDRISQPRAPLDILAQQIVAECACEDWQEDDLFDFVRRAWPYRDLSRDDFDDVVEMLSEGVGEGAGRSPAHIHRDRINSMLHGRRGARMTAILNGGAIPEMADYRVVAEPDDTLVGTVNEDWAIESMAGDIFLLGTHSWRIKRVGAGEVRVEDARGAPPTIPFWLGESPGRSLELSQEVGRLRHDLDAIIQDSEKMTALLTEECALDQLGAVQIIDYLRATREALGLVPTDTEVVFERFFDETGGMQLVVHAPFGARINRAWGLTLRKRFCVRFDFELQAAASDDSIVLSLGPQHSFPLEESFAYVTSRNAEESLRQAVLYAPVFAIRWRWDAARALAVPRFQGPRKVPPPIQRMRADDLLAAVFPAQVGCQENASGPLTLPDHPLIRQTVEDCLREANDIDGLISVLERIEAGEVRLHAVDTLEPSPMAHEIIAGKPYTFLDDAPLEERRTRAVTLRRALPESARELGSLDADAIERVRQEAWPDPRDAEEVHEALLSLVAIPAHDAMAWQPWIEQLTADGRAGSLTLPQDSRRLFFAAENLLLVQALNPDAAISLSSQPPEAALQRIEDRDDARTRLLRGWSEAIGPILPQILGDRLGLAAQDVERGLRVVEAGGFVLRGRFTPGVSEDEYCDRRLLSRIHRYTLDRLRREIDPASAQDFMRFLLRWQHLTPTTKLDGKAGVRQAVARLQGYEAAGSGWEPELLAARVKDYRPSWLDELCLAGEIAWARLTPRKTATNGEGAGGRGGAGTASRVTPISLTLRSALPMLLAAVRGEDGAASSAPKAGAAAEIHELLSNRGALFFDEVVSGTRRLRSDVERGMRELIARGLVTADGFQGLRQLFGRGGQRQRRSSPRSGFSLAGGLLNSSPSGRWSLVQSPQTEEADRDDLVEGIAGVLLQRYGVIFRDLYPRESISLPWRDLLRALRRLEARGLVRGGRFVSGFAGEQYALPEAVDALRAVRRTERSEEKVWVSALDPANLAGIVVAGTKVPAVPGKGILYIDGLPQEPAGPAMAKSPVPTKLPGRHPAATH